MKHVVTFLAAVLAAFVLAATGGYILFAFHTTFGLIGGAGLIVTGVAIALPIQLQEGAIALKANVVLAVPVIVDALKGGSRRTDPKDDGKGGCV